MSKSNEYIQCFECRDGVCRPVRISYTAKLPNNDSLTVPNVLVHRCEACGEESFPPETSRHLDKAIEEHEETIPVEFLESFLKTFSLDQSTAAEALGLGGKTFHRWLKGSHRVSRSMGFFLRAMMHDPSVFEWVRCRGWRTRTAVVAQVSKSASLEVRFSAIYARVHGDADRLATNSAFNPAKSFFSVGS